MEQTENLLFIPYERLHENPNNPRVIRDIKFRKLVTSLMEFPEMLTKRPVVVVTDKDGYMVLGGNMRLKAIPVAIKGIKKKIAEDTENEAVWRRRLLLLERGVPVSVADDWTQEQRDEFIIKDNVSYGEHDWELLANEWDSSLLIHWGMDIPDTEIIPKDPEDDDFDMELPLEPVTAPGDVYELGDHRLVCGDATHSTTAAWLLTEGKKANLCFTSPPYWVGMAYETQKNEEEINRFIRDVTQTIVLCMHADNSRIVINTGTSSINRIDKKRKVEILPLIDKWGNELRKTGWLLRHLRIWVKRGQLPASIAPRTDTIDQHNEYIAAFEKEWSQVLTFWEPTGDQRGQERINTPWAQQGVWDDVHGEKSSEGRHIAAFPVDIPFRNILLYTKKGEIVIDLFGGSGTTLIAAEQLKRICYISELSAAYCDVIITRWLLWRKQHGLPCEIKRNGVPFDFEIKQNK